MRGTKKEPKHINLCISRRWFIFCPSFYIRPNSFTGLDCEGSEHILYFTTEYITHVLFCLSSAPRPPSEVSCSVRFQSEASLLQVPLSSEPIKEKKRKETEGRLVQYDLLLGNWNIIMTTFSQYTVLYTVCEGLCKFMLICGFFFFYLIQICKNG